MIMLNIKRLKEPGSAITHFIGMMMAAFAAVPLIMKAMSDGRTVIISCLIFATSMILLYGASTIYHAVDKGERINKILKKLDHAMIFILIAGSYTPICLLVIRGKTGLILLAIVWLAAIVGIVFKMCWVTCPRWLSSAMYIAMGWMCVLAFTPIINNTSLTQLIWLLLGGVIYTVGGIVYAIKTPRVQAFNRQHEFFGTHEIFHVLVMLGSICHFIMIYNFIG